MAAYAGHAAGNARWPVNSTNRDAEAWRAWRGMPRNVVVLGVVSFFADVSSEMAYPLVPIFLSSVLGAPAAVIGLIEGVAEGTASLVKLAAGWWSDRVQRRLPLVAGGYALGAAGKVLLAAAFAWPLVLFARFIDRCGKGLRSSPRDALIADSVDAAQRGRAFGLHRSLDTAGAVLGPLLALALVALLDGRLRAIFLIAAIPGALSVIALGLVHEPRRVQPPRRALAARRPRARELFAGPAGAAFRLFLLALLVFALGNSSDVFLILRARDLGLSTTAVVLAYVLYNVVYMSLAAPLGALSDRVPRRTIMAGGLLVFAAVYAGFALADRALYVWPLMALYGCYIAATDGIARALVVDLVPAEARATALGWHGMLVGLGAVASSIVAGQLWDHVGVAAPFALGAAAALGGALLLLRVPARPPALA